MRGAAIAGALVLAAHAALPVAMRSCTRDDLEVRLGGQPVSQRLDLTGWVPASLGDRVALTVDGEAATGVDLTAPPPPPAQPGLHRLRWRVGYRGGHVREVGAAQLVGPFQDPAHPPCGGRLVVGQRFLDDGAAGDGTVAALIRRGLETELRDFDQFPVGRFVKIAGVDVRWARFDDPDADRGLFGDLTGAVGPALASRWHTDGFVRIHVVVELSRVSADVIVAAIPHVDGDQLGFELAARAKVRSGNRVVDFALDTFRADAYATKVVREQIDAAILQAFGPPPPLELPGGRALRVVYCPGAHVEVATSGWAALPLALVFDGPAAHGALPPRLGPAPPPAPSPATALAFDLDLDTVNALLHELWRTGFLDEQLAAAGLDDRFNTDPTVLDLLTLRISPFALALPPVVTPGPHGLRMAADLRLQLGDGPVVTPARAWAALDVELDPAAPDPAVTLAELELACEPTPALLRPCYGDLVAAMRDRAGDARAELSGVLVRVLDELFTGRRVTPPDTPATLVLGAPRITAHRAAPAAPTATVRIEVDARLEPL